MKFILSITIIFLLLAGNKYSADAWFLGPSSPNIKTLGTIGQSDRLISRDVSEQPYKLFRYAEGNYTFPNNVS